MSVYIRLYKTLGEVSPEERFLARAIAPEVSRDGKRREGFSVCFYAETSAAAALKAAEWIDAERERAAEKADARRAAAEKRRAQP